jgi:hypothetical protein
MNDLCDYDKVCILIDAWNAGSLEARDALRRWVGWEDGNTAPMGVLIVDQIDILTRSWNRVTKEAA